MDIREKLARDLARATGMQPANVSGAEVRGTRAVTSPYTNDPWYKSMSMSNTIEEYVADHWRFHLQDADTLLALGWTKKE